MRVNQRANKSLECHVRASWQHIYQLANLTTMCIQRLSQSLSSYHGLTNDIWCAVNRPARSQYWIHTKSTDRQLVLPCTYYLLRHCIFCIWHKSVICKLNCLLLLYALCYSILRQSLTPETTKTLVHAFVKCRPDYCNSLLAGVSNQLLHRMQVVQNAGARFITGARRSESMTSVMSKLHWLPVRQKITYKTAVLVYKCLHGLAPSYLAALCVSKSRLVQPHLRSALTGQLNVPCTKTAFGDRSFTVNCPAVWNCLLAKLHTPDIFLDVCRKHLKTFPFNWLWVNCQFSTSDRLPNLLFINNINEIIIGVVVVVARGLHWLSCCRSAPRKRHHSQLNDIIWRALKRAQIPAAKEPVSLVRDDNKRPDGTTLLPWASGKPTAWDVTVPDTYAKSHHSHVSSTAVHRVQQLTEQHRAR